MPYVYVEVDLEEFDDDEIIAEYNSRSLGDAATDDVETLTKIWIHDREGRKEEAYALMREYVLNKMNKVV
jgi:hypothetical protein